MGLVSNVLSLNFFTGLSLESLLFWFKLRIDVTELVGVITESSSPYW